MHSPTPRHHLWGCDSGNARAAAWAFSLARFRGSRLRTAARLLMELNVAAPKHTAALVCVAQNDPELVGVTGLTVVRHGRDVLDARTIGELARALDFARHPIGGRCVLVARHTGSLHSQPRRL